MTTTPKVSICIPTYNQVRFIREAVETALAQNFDSFEVVVSDNHCTDGTSEYLQTVQDPRFRLVRPPEHLVVTKHFDFCASQSRGEYINFLSSDDNLHPDYASKMAACLDASPGASFAYCASWLLDGEGRNIGLERNIGGNRRRTSDEALRRFIRNQRCVFDTLLIRRDCFEACGRLAILRNGGYLLEMPDWDLDIRLAMVGDVVYLDEVLVGFRYWSAENREANQVRLPRYIEEIGRMFDTTVAEVVAARPHLRAEAAAARRALGVNCALGVGELYGLASYEENVKNVLRIHDSALVRFILALHRIRLTPVIEFGRATKGMLRRHVKQLLYQG